jgi:hypothetical protein
MRQCADGDRLGDGEHHHYDEGIVVVMADPEDHESGLDKDTGLPVARLSNCRVAQVRNCPVIRVRNYPVARVTSCPVARLTCDAHSLAHPLAIAVDVGIIEISSPVRLLSSCCQLLTFVEAWPIVWRALSGHGWRSEPTDFAKRLLPRAIPGQ